MASDDPIRDIFGAEEYKERRRLEQEAYKVLRNQFGNRRSEGIPSFHPSRTKKHLRDEPTEKLRKIVNATPAELEAMAKNGELWYH